MNHSLVRATVGASALVAVPIAGIALRRLLRLFSRSPHATKPPLQQLPRAAHWVIRSSDLKRTVTFLESVFGCAVLRHEENDEPCGITCNGRFENAWSKTMVGFPGHHEDEWYCLEVTYNYGIWSYDKDSALQYFAIGVPDPDRALAEARAMGCAVAGNIITGPDGYAFAVLPKTRPESFLYVKVRVSDVDAARSFYCEKLGMEDLTARYALPDDCAGGVVLGFNDGWTVPVIAVGDGVPVRWSTWTGRFAISMPGAQIKAVYEELPSANVVHELQELHEKLGVLVITIVRDGDGYETCLVSSEFFDPSTREATDWKSPDWEARRQLIDSRAQLVDRGRSS